MVKGEVCFWWLLIKHFTKLMTVSNLVTYHQIKCNKNSIFFRWLVHLENGLFIQNVLSFYSLFILFFLFGLYHWLVCMLIKLLTIWWVSNMNFTVLLKNYLLLGYIEKVKSLSYKEVIGPLIKLPKAEFNCETTLLTFEIFSQANFHSSLFPPSNFPFLLNTFRKDTNW